MNSAPESTSSVYFNGQKVDFESKDSFDCYGCHKDKNDIFYRTTSKEYGYFPPGPYSIPMVYYPIKQKFSNELTAAGMYRNHSLNTVMDPPPYKNFMAKIGQEYMESSIDVQSKRWGAILITFLCLL